LILSLLLALCLSFASLIEPWYQNWSRERNKSADILTVLIGDSRRLFANHFFAKADVYFHNGYYPTIFDAPKMKEESHMAGGDERGEPDEDEHHVHDENCHHEEETDDNGFLGPPKDIIDRFSRNFFPSRHTHLGKNGDEREILPWIRLSAELNPQQVDSYTIAAYWLRSRLGKVKEAEQFLREGLRANPWSYEIYFELGRIHDENRNDPQMARNLWEVALRKWEDQAKAGANPDGLIYLEIVGHLAKAEENQGDFKQAIHYLKLLKEKSPNPEAIEKQIKELEQKVSR
jgi:tetratricopeptide (TPR) repeat protein